jgi:hypothetical protein
MDSGGVRGEQMEQRHESDSTTVSAIVSCAVVNMCRRDTRFKIPKLKVLSPESGSTSQIPDSMLLETLMWDFATSVTTAHVYNGT